MAANFKPNIYPIIYWALAFGVSAGVVLFLVNILARFITLVWFPVFLAGVVWGGYRNYQRQKQAWQAGTGQPTTPDSPLNEFKQAVSDIASASRDMMAEAPAEAASAEEPAPEAIPTPPANPTTQPPTPPIV